MKIFWVKVLKFFVNRPKFFSPPVQNKIIFNFVTFVATKKVELIFFRPSLLLLFLDPGSGIREIRNLFLISYLSIFS
jgi:hypothetical protein